MFCCVVSVVFCYVVSFGVCGIVLYLLCCVLLFVFLRVIFCFVVLFCASCFTEFFFFFFNISNMCLCQVFITRLII